jgi:anti-sigma factor RsiW
MADDIRECGDLDERLSPYVDGEDSPAAHRAVDAHLAKCPPCRADATAETAARKLVHEHRDALTRRASDTLRARCAAAGSQLPLSPLQSSSRRSSFLRKWAPLSLAATLVLAVAGVFVFGLNDRVEALAASLSVDHVKCFKVNGIETHADADTSERAWQQSQGWPVVIPQTEAAQQLQLVNVRRCLTTDGHAAHLMYTWRGEPLSLYVLQGDAGRDRVVKKMGAQTVVWCSNQRTYAVVSSDTSRDLTSIVDYMKTRVR